MRYGRGCVVFYFTASNQVVQGWLGCNCAARQMWTPRKLRDFFDNYGGSARTVYRSRNDMRRADYEDAVMAAVEDMDINLLHKLNSVEDKSSNQRFKNASSKLFIVRTRPQELPCCPRRRRVRLRLPAHDGALCETVRCFSLKT